MAQALRQLVLERLQFAEPRHHGAAAAAVLHERYKLLDLLPGFGQRLAVGVAGRAALAVEAVGLLGIGAHRLRRDLRRHEPVPEPGQHARFQRLAGDGAAVGATAVHDVVGAGVAVLAAQRVGTAAAAADKQAGEQRARAVHAVQAVGVGAAWVASMTPAYLTASSSCRCFTACQSASSTMRSSGTSTVIQSSGGLIRETRLPVVGSLT